MYINIINYYVEYGARNCFQVKTWPQGQGQLLDRIRCPGRMSMSSLAITSSLTWWPIHIESTRLEFHGCVNDMSTSPGPLKLPLIARRCKEQSSFEVSNCFIVFLYLFLIFLMWAGEWILYLSRRAVQGSFGSNDALTQLSMWSQVGLLETFKLRKCQMVKCNCAT